MSFLQLMLLVLTVLVLGGLLWVGQREDRIGAVVFIVALLAPPLIEPLVIGNIRWGLALLSVGLLSSLIGLVMTSRRWWIIAAAGFQLVATSSYAVSLARPEMLIWTGVSLRLVLWFLQMIACGFGIAEALSHRKALQLKTRPSGPYFPTGYNR